MFAHCILLLSPDLKNHLGLIITSEKHHHTASAALKASKFGKSHSDWWILGFMSSRKEDMQSPAKMLTAQVPGPGSIVSVVA